MNKEDRLFYGAYAPALENGQAYMLEEIQRILGEISDDAEHAPAEHIRSRIKSAGSMREKLKKRGHADCIEAGLTHLSDVIGVRIVTHFVGDVYLILEKLKASGKWEVVQVKDYIANSKPNGYRSLHVILRLPLDCGELTHIDAEIQLRTIAMDCWASLEHQLKYKKDIQNAELISAELKRCADEIASTDLSMQTIRELMQNS